MLQDAFALGTAAGVILFDRLNLFITAVRRDAV